MLLFGSCIDDNDNIDIPPPPEQGSSSRTPGTTLVTSESTTTTPALLPLDSRRDDEQPSMEETLLLQIDVLSLPDELICEILLYLSFRTGRSLALSCHHIFALMTHHSHLRSHFRRQLEETEVVGFYKLEKHGEGRQETMRREVLIEYVQKESEDSEGGSNKEPRAGASNLDPHVAAGVGMIVKKSGKNANDSAAAPEMSVDNSVCTVSFLFEDEGVTAFYGDPECCWSGVRGSGTIPTADLVRFWFACQKKKSSPPPAEEQEDSPAKESVEEKEPENEFLAARLRLKKTPKLTDLLIVKKEADPPTESRDGYLNIECEGGMYMGEENGSLYGGTMHGTLSLRFVVVRNIMSCLKMEFRVRGHRGYRIPGREVNVEEEDIPRLSEGGKITASGRRRRRRRRRRRD